MSIDINYINKNVSIMIITHDIELANPVKESLAPLETDVFYAPNYPSFSKVCNEAICRAKNQIVIICSYKARPNVNDVINLLKLLDEGFGFVGPYRFGFFGFRKNLIKRIGFFDERYVGGGYEDADFLRRVVEANIAFYDNESIHFIQKPSTWKYTQNQYTHNFHKSKWDENYENKTVRRCFPEEKYDYILNSTEDNIEYKDRTYSLSPWSQDYCRNYKFI